MEGVLRCTNARAALVSTRTCSALVGKPQLPHRVLVEFRPAGRKQQQPVGFVELVGDTLSIRIAAPSREISTSPAVMPACSRSDFGITKRPALSMVVRIP